MKERIYRPSGFSTENDSSLITPEQIKKFSFLIEAAKEAYAYPDQSGYFVKTAGITKGGTLWTGGNKEYGNSDAFIHGETAVVSGLRDMTDDPIEAIAFYHDGEVGPDNVGRPCGNCRDILQKYCEPDTFILSGNESAIVCIRLKDLFFDNFRRIEPTLTRMDNFYIIRGQKAARAGNGEVYVVEGQKMTIQPYGAVLVSETGEFWTGRHYTNVAYDSVTPVMSAILNWQNNYPIGTVDERSLRMERLIIVGEKETVPHVFYRDRQALIEFDEILRMHTGNPNPLRVEIVSVDQSYYSPSKIDKGVNGIYETNAREWLPSPFSPEAFGMNDVLAQQLARLTGGKEISTGSAFR